MTMSRYSKYFVCNLRSGLRLALFRPCSLHDFRFSLDQLAALIFSELLLEVIADFLLVLPKPEFSIYALPTFTFELGCFFLAAYVIGKLLRRNFAVLQIGVIVYSIAPLMILLRFLLSHLSAQSPDTMIWPYHLFSAYSIIVMCRVLHLVSRGLTRITISALALMLISLSVSQAFYGEYKHFWFAGDNPEKGDTADPYAEYRALDAETLMYRQPAILDLALAKLRPQRNKTVELFFVGFAGFATEDVFSKEVDYARRLLDKRFDTEGHSINLINHLNTLEQSPLATSTNLALTLKRIGKIMNKEEDMLLLYLTSHGSKNELSVSFWPLALNHITPEKLNAMLDEADIKWRMIIISACYSGGFVKALQGPTTLVATAAAADKTSFGCGSESEFTYFGEAVFKDQLNRQSSFITALQQAVISIGRREIREQLEPSRPQLSIGTAIEAKLKHLDEAMHQYHCNLAKTQDKNC